MCSLALVASSLDFTTSAEATKRAPVCSMNSGEIQLPRPPHPISPNSTVELACDPNTVFGCKRRMPPALRRSRRFEESDMEASERNCSAWEAHSSGCRTGGIAQDQFGIDDDLLFANF